MRRVAWLGDDHPTGLHHEEKSMEHRGHRRPETGIVASYLRDLRRQAREETVALRRKVSPSVPYVPVRGRRTTGASSTPPGPRYS
jgi:hypothetical protein